MTSYKKPEIHNVSRVATPSEEGRATATGNVQTIGEFLAVWF